MVSEYEFDVLIGADGKRNTLQGMYYKHKKNLQYCKIMVKMSVLNDIN